MTQASSSSSARPGLALGLLLAVMVGHELSYGLCVQDDAFISFRYASNLVAGDGLVFNPGDPVEGYTNFLWTLLMAAVMAIGLDPVMPSVVGGIAASLGVMVVAWALTRELAPGDRPWVALAAPALLAADPGLALESVQGLESSFFSLLVGGGLLAALREDAEPDRPPVSAGLFALAALTRPEGVLAMGLVTLARLIRTRGRLGRSGWAGVGLFALVFGGHEVFRIAYYGDIVPNTFHAKVGGGVAALPRGVQYLVDFATRHMAITAAAVAGLVGGAAGLRRNPRWLMPLVLLVPWLLYVVSVGGDFKGTGRFVLPLLAPAVALGLAVVSERLRDAPSRAAVFAGVLALVAFAVDLPRGYPPAKESAGYRAVDMAQRLTVGTWLRESVPPGTLLAIHSAGTIPYASGLPAIDLWGLSDRHIAQAEVAGMGTGTAGHEKKDYDYAFGLDPVLYVPEEGFLTTEPVRLPVPADFPADFEDRYDQMSVRVGDRWLNLFHRAGWTPGR